MNLEIQQNGWFLSDQSRERNDLKLMKRNENVKKTHEDIMWFFIETEWEMELQQPNNNNNKYHIS